MSRQHVPHNFLNQVIDSPSRGSVFLDLMVTNICELSGDVKVGGSLNGSDHALMEFLVLRDMDKVYSIVRSLNFRKANFSSSRRYSIGSPGRLTSGTRSSSELAGL